MLPVTWLEGHAMMMIKRGLSVTRSATDYSVGIGACYCECAFRRIHFATPCFRGLLSVLQDPPVTRRFP